MTNVQAFILGNNGENSGNVSYLVAFFEVGGNYLTTASIEAPLTDRPETITGWNNIIAYRVGIYATDNDYVLNQKDIVWAVPNILDKPVMEATGGIESGVIDGKTVSNKTIFTNTSGKNFLVTDVFIVPTSLSGVGTPPIINVGKNSTGYSDIISGLSLGVLTALGVFTKTSPISGASVVANNESVVVRVATAGLLYTTYDFKVVLQGIYIS